MKTGAEMHASDLITHLLETWGAWKYTIKLPAYNLPRSLGSYVVHRENRLPP